jgi:5'-3' exoribonuclease 2
MLTLFCHYIYKLFPAMGKTISEDDKHKKSWDSNAITPGTPFMELLAKSLRYWVVQKLNSDPGWKQVGHTFYFLHLVGS